MADDSELKYKKPKIIIIDMPESLVDSIRSNGYNVVSGTFGTPYKVSLSDNFLPVTRDASLPNLEEQEIICIDLSSPETSNESLALSITAETKTFYARCDQGKIDPRPISALLSRQAMDTIFENGGIFIIFASFDYPQEIFFGNHHKVIKKWEITPWSFLSILENLQKIYSAGEEILIENNIELLPFLSKYTENGSFDTTLEVYGEFLKSWIPLLKNKYGKCIGGIITQPDKGIVIILPQLSNKEEIILGALRESLPEYRPNLFPEIEAGRWLKRDEYEFEEVKNLNSQIDTIENETKEKIAILNNKIIQERERLNYLHGIITKTGTPLVEDIEIGLGLVFDDIINIDEEIPEEMNLQEDLQIKDRSTAILVEIKGLSGFPSESDIAQLVKFMIRRMREWKQQDVRGCFIVNHQRHIPPLNRNNETVFTKEQNDDAVNNEIALFSSWQIYKLLKGMQKWGWDQMKVQDIFYQSGWFSGVPPFYEPIGKITNYYAQQNVVGVEIVNGKLKIGDRIGYITQLGYLEENIESMQVNGKNVVEANLGQGVGIKTEYSKDSIKDAKQLYLVSN